MTETFSDRYGYGLPDAEIYIREDAPEMLRGAILMIVRALGMTPKTMRDVICQVLLVAPDRSNWSDYPNVWEEVNDLMAECSWFKVYDIAEALHAKLAYRDPNNASTFTARLNQFFREGGIGWEMQDGSIVFRGEVFTESTGEAVTVLTETGRTGAANEIGEAIRDISRRPQPDITGAIQHAMAALESTARDVTGRPNRTLGRLVNELDLPRPLDTAVEKLWGFASDRARHIREAQAVDIAEAELVVSIACAVCTFLAKQNQPGSPGFRLMAIWLSI